MSQVKQAQERSPPDLDTLYRQSESWTIPARDAEGVESPGCGYLNVPGEDECEMCLSSLREEEMPVAEARKVLEASLYHDAVASLEPAAAVSLPESATVATAVGAMKEERIGSVLVTDDNGRLSGIFTERDLLARAVAEEIDPEERTIGETMTHAPETIELESSLAQAFHRMTVSDLGYLPLVDDEERPVSIVASRDLIEFLSARVES